MYSSIQRGRIRAQLLGTAIGAMVFASASSAAVAQVQGGTAAAGSDQIETVVVTAEKRSERLQDVPASITALDAKNFSEQGIYNLQDFASQVPGLSLDSGQQGYTQVALRGITTGSVQSAAATAIYIDEAPIGSVNAYAKGSLITADLDPEDVAQVEVLKGPQGTLYGAGAMGGVLKYVMVQPDDSQFSAHASVGGEDVSHGGDGYRLAGGINVPIVTDTLGLLVSGYDRFDPGYIKDVIGGRYENGTRAVGGRVALGWQVDSHVSVELSALGQNLKSDGSNFEDVSYPTLKPIYGDLENRRYFAEPLQFSTGVYNGTIKGSWGNLDLVSTTTYEDIRSHGQTDGTDAYGIYIYAFYHGLNPGLSPSNAGVIALSKTGTKRFTQEFRANSSLFDGKLEYQIGLYFTHENDLNEVPGFPAYFTTTGAPVTETPNFIQASILSRYTEYSAYGNLTYHFTPNFDVLAGLRYSTDNQHYYQNYSGLLAGAAAGVHTATSSDNVVTYQVTPEYKFDEDSMIYAKVATGYRPGGPNPAPPPNPLTFAPDKLTSYETGYKATLLDNHLTLDASLFYIDWKDIQIQTSSGAFKYFVNGGNAKSEGGELSINYVPIAGMTLGLNAAYTDARLTSPAPTAGGLDGDWLPYVPNLSGSFVADYRWLLGNDWVGHVGGTVSYVGERWNDFTGSQTPTPLTPRDGFRLPSYTTLDLRAGVDYNNWSLSFYVRNVGDARGITLANTEGLKPGANPYDEGFIQPRTVGAEVSARFP